MADDDVRSRVARRMSSEEAPPPTSVLGRSAGLVGGFARAGAKSIGRTVARAVGRRTDDLDPEAELAASFGRLKGVVTKMGQVLGYVDVGLPDSVRAALSALHTSTPALDAERIRKVLDEDFGDPGKRLARAMEPRALASASIGQVHRASLEDGTSVVVKVLHPGLSTIIERDFAPAMFASRVSGAVHALLGDVRDRLLEECSFTLEARRQRRFAEIFREHDTIVVPEVHDAFSSNRVLTTTYVDGVHLDAFLAGDPSPAARTHAGEALFDFYVVPLFRYGLYNRDPNPGNYLFLSDGRVAFVDFGSTGEFLPPFRERLASLSRAVASGDPDEIHAALLALGLDEHVPYDREVTLRLLRTLFGPLAKDEVTAFDPAGGANLRELLGSAWKARRLAVSGELVFLLRTYAGVSSVLARLGARANWRRRLEGVVARSALASTSVPPLPDATELEWDVVLVERGETPIALIRVLRELMGGSLRELEDIASSAPVAVAAGLPRGEAELVKRRLESAGARADVRRASPRS